MLGDRIISIYYSKVDHCSCEGCCEEGWLVLCSSACSAVVVVVVVQVLVLLLVVIATPACCSCSLH